MALDRQNPRKFLSLPEHRQHKLAALTLRKVYIGEEPWEAYRAIEKLMALPVTGKSFEDVSNRYHFHMHAAHIDPTEIHMLTTPITRLDGLSQTEHLPISIYMDSLRSAYNVGSIIRTTEALRLGSLHFSKTTPYIDHLKVQKTALGATDFVDCFKCASPQSLKGPYIALETAENATPLPEFEFPASFTLLLGNEEFGLSKQSLELADHIVEIPLAGAKNSINVASAFAIAGYEIRRQRQACR